MPPVADAENRLNLPLAVFFCSFSSISLEILLTRVFSVALLHHLAYMVVSIAMLGIAVSGTLLSLYPSLNRPCLLGKYSLLLSASIPIGYALANSIPLDPAMLSWDSVQLLYVSLYYIVLLVPFLLFGLIVAGSLSFMQDRAGYVYGADLLGAGAGSLAAIAMLRWLVPEHGMLAASFGALIGSFLLGKRRMSIVLGLALIVIAITSPKALQLRISPYKELPRALNYPGAKHLKTYRNGFTRVDTFKSPMARFAPGLSLKYQEELPEQVGLSVEASNINAITMANGDGLEFLEFLPSALGYETGKRHSALVIDPGGGLQVLMARHYGAKDVNSFESNPLIPDIVKNDYSEFSGGIFAENARSGLARGRLKAMDRKFDIIDLTLMGATPSAGFGLAEDYRFTVEAFTEYIECLSENGVLSISLYILPPSRTEFRLLATALSGLEKSGITESHRHLMAIRSWGSITMLIKNTQVTALEVESLKAFSRSRNFDLVYYPGISEEETNVYVKMPTNEYFSAFRSIAHSSTREEFQKNYIFDVMPVYDKSPFFHYYLKPLRIGETYRLMGGKWQYFIEEGYILPAVLAQALLLSAVLIALPALRLRKKETSLQVSGEALRTIIYFSFLGIGFMFVEIPIFQAMILPLEHPSYAFAVVLSSILVSSGIGSRLGQKVRLLDNPRTLLVLAVFILPYSYLASSAMSALLHLHMPVKVALSFLLIMPLGVLLGVPLPLGIRHTPKELIPWAWASNGCFSVLAPMLAAMAAMAWSFGFVLAAGAVAYALAFLSGPWKAKSG